jgi:hypothetical protein
LRSIRAISASTAALPSSASGMATLVTRLIHHHVVAAVRAPAVHVHMRHSEHSPGMPRLAQRGGERQAVRAALRRL